MAGLARHFTYRNALGTAPPTGRVPAYQSGLRVHRIRSGVPPEPDRPPVAGGHGKRCKRIGLPVTARALVKI
jgi:hypothetical protein